MSLWILLEEIEETYPGQAIFGFSVGERIPLPSEKAVFPVLGALRGRMPSPSGRWGTFWAKALLGPVLVLPSSRVLGWGRAFSGPVVKERVVGPRIWLWWDAPLLMLLGFRVPVSECGLSG